MQKQIICSIIQIFKPEYTKVVEIDLSTISPAISGPKRPQDLIDLTEAKQTFQESLIREAGVQGFGLGNEEINKTATVHLTTMMKK